MKDNKDTFLRYLDDDLTPQERRDFEAKLESDEELNQAFQSFMSAFKSLKKEVEVDERYFNTLLPKVREKTENAKKGSSKIIRYAYFVPILIIGAIIFFNYNSGNNISVSYNFREIFESFIEDEELTMNLIEESLGTTNYYLYDSENEFMEELYSDNYEIDESYFNYAEENINPSDIDMTFLDNLTENEFNNIYEKLLDKKIIGD